ncbi:MAG TPA: TadG family pilus assembly protein [Bryobacteraceae bacterium]|nr:TadG family pilus assembly protein [Bryobacteraceae bacterium]
MIAATVALPALMAFLGLATDVGYLEWQKVHARLAADAAAQGAGLQLLDGNGSSAVVSEGQYDASLNGFTQGVSNTTVTVNTPPLSGPHTGNTSAVEVIVQRLVPTFFMNIVGSPAATVTARAVTVLGDNGGAGCVFAMNATVSQAFNFQGSNTAYFGCGLEVASSSSSALYMGGTAVLEMKNNASVGVVGRANLAGQTKILNYNTGQPLAVQQISAPSDPLNYVQAPSPSGTLHSSATNYDMNSKPPGNTIQPGIYCGGLTIGNTGGATFTMSKGLYYIAGGGLTINSQAIVTGTGVTIYNTSSANAGVSGCSGKSFAPITISGQANVTLSAPTNSSGPGIEGVLIFQDRKITSSSSTQINGGSTTQLNGAIYLLHSPLLYTGTNSSGGYQILVADTITINGNSNVTINSDYSSLQDGSPIHNAAILEE